MVICCANQFAKHDHVTNYSLDSICSSIRRLNFSSHIWYTCSEDNNSKVDMKSKEVHYVRIQIVLCVLLNLFLVRSGYGDLGLLVAGMKCHSRE